MKTAKPKSAASSRLSAATFKGEEALLDIEAIIKSPSLQAREKPEDVARQAEQVAAALKNPDETKKIDRVWVIRIPEGTTRKIDGAPIGAGDYLVDGFGRVGGFEQAGRSKIPALVRVGTWEDAIDVASSSNTQHKGMPRSSEDKRRAVIMTMVTHPEWSSRMVSEHCKVGNEMPNRLRPEAEKILALTKRIGDGTEAKPEPKKVVGRDGKERVAKKPKKETTPRLDWDGMISRLEWASRFLDSAVEVDGREGKNIGEFQKAHAAIGVAIEQAKAWRAKLTPAKSK